MFDAEGKHYGLSDAISARASPGVRHATSPGPDLGRGRVCEVMVCGTMVGGERGPGAWNGFFPGSAASLLTATMDQGVVGKPSFGLSSLIIRKDHSYEKTKAGVVIESSLF